MSYDLNWDIDAYKEDDECEDHWQIRREFMERWKTDYPEDKLVCLAKVFSNIELLGCRYPAEVMVEVARLSKDIAVEYRRSRKSKLQRTFVSASDAAEDRAKGIKREGGVVKSTPLKKNKIEFVSSGQNNDTIEIPDNDVEVVNKDDDLEKDEKKSDDPNDYMKELLSLKCVDVTSFDESMFFTPFGRLVLLVRPWTSKLCNIQSSCQVCSIQVTNTFENGCFTLLLNGQLLARATGTTKAEARSIVELMAWNRLREEVISVMFKEQFIAKDDTRISISDVTGQGRSKEEFGTPINNSVASKMMQMMGWKGGGLGADAQGIAEPIKPHLQMVDRAGLGSSTTDIRSLRVAAQALMRRYIASDSLDVDLVFSSQFSKEERATLHRLAQQAGLASKSYGDTDRFLVVKKKLDPFSLVRAVVEKGGTTPKYQVFIPVKLKKFTR